MMEFAQHNEHANNANNANNATTISDYIQSVNSKPDIWNLDRKVLVFRKKDVGTYFQEFNFNIAPNCDATKLHTFFTARLLYEMVKDCGILKIFHMYVDEDNGGNEAVIYILYRNYFKNFGVKRKYSLLHMRRHQHENTVTFTSVADNPTQTTNEKKITFLSHVKAINAQYGIDEVEDILPIFFAFESTQSPHNINELHIKGVSKLPDSFVVPQTIEKLALQLVTSLIKQTITSFHAMQI